MTFFLQINITLSILWVLYLIIFRALDLGSGLFEEPNNAEGILGLSFLIIVVFWIAGLLSYIWV